MKKNEEISGVETKRICAVVSAEAWNAVDRLLISLPMSFSRFTAVLLDKWALEQGLIKESRIAEDYNAIADVLEDLAAKRRSLG